MSDESTFPLDGDGLREVIWDECDAPFAGPFVASPAEAVGRGIALAVTRGGEAVDLTGASLYLLWRHRELRVRGCEPLEEVDAGAGKFRVYWPAAMAAAEGTVDAQVMVSWDERALSSLSFAVLVGPALVGGEGGGSDGYSLFLDALKKFEDADGVIADAVAKAQDAVATAQGAVATAGQAVEAAQGDLGVLTGECLLGMAGPIEAAGLEVEFAPPTQLVIATDREKLTRILQNLLRNAVQHGRDHLAVEVTAEGDGAALRVSNGVAEAQRIDAAQLFDRFYTADRSRSGRTSGLGLSIVRVLAEQLGGEVTARQDAAGGAVTISVRVPSTPSA